MHMEILTLIAAVAKNNVIGDQGTTPWNIPEEMGLFKRTTMGSVVIVGRKTYEDIGHPLPGRRTIVLSRTMSSVSSPELAVCSSIPEALEAVQEAKRVFVIGGEQIYAQMMPFADELRISHLKKAYEGDSFFPDIDTTLWKIVEKQEFPDFTHSRYKRI